MPLSFTKSIIAILLLTNPVQAGFDDIWGERIAREPEETGIASVYSDQKTASGELFDGKALTCAHRSRPLCTALEDARGVCPSRSKITVRLAGKAVQCRVNDRGPFIKGRVIDLSEATAKALGLTWKQGLGKVMLY